MTPKLFIQALTKFFAGLIIVGLLLFLPAGTCAYWQAWLFIGILFVPMFIAGIWLMWKHPELLSKRLSAKEEQNEQKWVVALSGLLFIAMFVGAGLNFRFGWLFMPNWTIYVAAGIFLLGYALYAEVMRENVWLSRTVEVQENQQVIDTGLYGIVRHPMYSATLLLFLSMPLVLNSVWSFALMLLYIPIIVKRIRNEEVVLEQDLAGYKEYKQRVRYRLIPYIW
ncbi:MAG: isoprenylcysteine carboxylmethyltransferase family protein [Paludibacteraceae bacterium]|nr:isoprenylcysteine carboxylmethyltransferase family protein [Paludibacteraceae bacterium]